MSSENVLPAIEPAQDVFTSRHRGTSKLNALTGLRFFAAALIVIEHLEGFGLPSGFLQRWPLDNGVAFFFVLSGFILSYVYPTLATREAVRRFLVARFARIWPMHATALVLLYLLLNGDPTAYGVQKDTLLLGLSNLALVHAWIPISDIFFSYNSVSWTISTEFFFYLLFPLLLWNFERSWWWKLALAFAAVVALIELSNAAGLSAYAGPSMTITRTGLVYINPLARLFEFVLGMGAALAWRTYRSRVRLEPDLGTAVEAAVVLLVLYNAYQVQIIAAYGSAWFGPAAGEWLAHGGAVCCSVAVLVFVMACGQGHISRAVGSRAGVFLGEISFSMYMIHYVILRAYAMRTDWFAAWPGYLKLAAFIIVLFGMSAALWKFVEKPLRSAILERFAPTLAGPRPANAVSADAWES